MGERCLPTAEVYWALWDWQDPYEDGVWPFFKHRKLAMTYCRDEGKFTLVPDEQRRRFREWWNANILRKEGSSSYG